MASDKKFDLDGFSVDTSGNVTCDGGVTADDGFTGDVTATSITGGAGESIDVVAEGALSLDGQTGVFLGLSSNKIFLSYPLPTSDPTTAGQVWNDLGTLKISDG